MRKKQNIKKIIVSSILAILCLVLITGIGLGFSYKKDKKQYQGIENVQTIQKTDSVSDIKKDEPQEEVSFSKKATFKIGDDEFVIQVSEHTTVYDAMNSLVSEGKMTFDGKVYQGLGFFVTQINSLTSGDGKNLMYYINDTEASLGVSSYVIKEGDIIEWKLK